MRNHPPITAARLASLLLLYWLLVPGCLTAAGFLLGLRLSGLTFPVCALGVTALALWHYRAAGRPPDVHRQRLGAGRGAGAVKITATGLAVSPEMTNFAAGK